jgi:hypothetical protein
MIMPGQAQWAGGRAIARWRPGCAAGRFPPNRRAVPSPSRCRMVTRFTGIDGRQRRGGESVFVMGLGEKVVTLRAAKCPRGFHAVSRRAALREGTKGEPSSTLWPWAAGTIYVNPADDPRQKASAGSSAAAAQDNLASILSNDRSCL